MTDYVEALSVEWASVLQLGESMKYKVGTDEAEVRHHRHSLRLHRREMVLHRLHRVEVQLCDVLSLIWSNLLKTK